MKRLTIICEGPTELEFCKDVLIPHFNQKSIFVTQLLANANGGIISWHKLKNKIEKYLYLDNSVYVTTFIDYYGIQSKHNFPNWDKALNEQDKYTRLKLLEEGMLDDIDPRNNKRERFIPFLILHEFEGLLFNDIQAFRNLIPSTDFIDFRILEQIVIDFPNPELINDTPESSPSHRLKKLIKGYNKVVYGAILAREIGLPNIRAKSPKFNEWILRLESL